MEGSIVANAALALSDIGVFVRDITFAGTRAKVRAECCTL